MKPIISIKSKHESTLHNAQAYKQKCFVIGYMDPT